MSSGGRTWSSSRRRVSSADIERSVSKATANVDYEAKTNGFLQELLGEYNNRDADSIRTHIETIHKAIEKEIEGELDTLFGGSVIKHTYVDGISDVDVLLTVNASELADSKPAEVLEYVEQRLSQRLGVLGVTVKAGDLAVTVSYADGTEIQVLPALKTASGVRIASPDGTWSSVVRPQDFAKKLTAVNQANNGRVVPVIKLFKGLQTKLPPNSQLKGYHVESLAIEAFNGYQGRQTLKDMLQHFVKYSADRVSTPIADSTGQSRHVDDYLGKAGSAGRQRVGGALKRLADRLTTADERNSLDTLKDTFGE